VLRQNISSSIKKVILAFEESGTLLVLKSAVSARVKVSSNTEALSSFPHLMHISKSFGKAEWKIINIFGITEILKSSFWSLIISPEEKRHPAIMDAYQNLHFLSEHLPKIIKLLDRDIDALKEKLTIQNEKKLNNTEALLTITLAEEDEYSSSSRLVLALEAINGLYDAINVIERDESIQLSVISCDSGSDKSFDFLGAAKSIETVREIILGLWDKVIFYKEDKINKKLELISNSLPILERISSMKESGSLEPEQAELLKRQITGSVGKLLSAGVTIPEMDERAHFEPRLLMQPEKKLLVAPENATDKNELPLEEDEETINDPEFEKYMEEMAKKFLKGKKKKPNE
jgi:hypothetical protein